ncbi:MAG: hypothetical protein ACRDRW_04545 [Pseudonocardiaceae bacterium]
MSNDPIPAWQRDRPALLLDALENVAARTQCPGRAGGRRLRGRAPVV